MNAGILKGGNRKVFTDRTALRQDVVSSMAATALGIPVEPKLGYSGSQVRNQGRKGLEYLNALFLTKH